jgi:hypothetical protein
LEKLSCRYLAVAPEFDSKDYQLMNTGVMLMNLKNLIAVEEKFRNFLVSNLEKLPCWDQSAYQWFYKRPRGNFVLGADGIAFPLRLIGNPTGEIIQGQNRTLPWSPFQRQYLKSAKCPEILRDLAKGSYDELCNLWAKMLEETTKTDETI